ncbi:MAG TPA: thioredoxin [Flavisolibacter sp.]|jgi:thiol-disulfide isomerase/thioredoxin|nr:thioredoxin [Flavisolibacter sp.]
MKKGLVFFLFLFTVLIGQAQVDTTTPPYKKFPTLPPVQILLGDSTTKFTKESIAKGKPVLFMVFSPDCSHCQHEAEELVAHRDEMKDIQIVMITLHPLWQMNEFVKNYKLDQLKNVVVGKDVYYIMPSFYNIGNLPFLAMYNKNGGLISVFEGSLGISKVIDLFKQNQ